MHMVDMDMIDMNIVDTEVNVFIGVTIFQRVCFPNTQDQAKQDYLSFAQWNVGSVSKYQRSKYQ